jgi:biopolymer transport protein ExbB
VIEYFMAHAEAMRVGDLTTIGVLFAKDVLMLFSIVSVGVIIERIVNLRRMRHVEESEYAELRTLLIREDGAAATAKIASSAAPSATAVQAGIDLQGANDDLVHEAVTQGIEVQSAVLHRNLPILATIASTAPYVGLFGTVLGILQAFGKIAATGQTGASVVAAPIAEALTATALGLGVAIPAVMAYNYFSGRVNDLTLRVETHTLDLAARLASLKTPATAEVGGKADAR